MTEQNSDEATTNQPTPPAAPVYQQPPAYQQPAPYQQAPVAPPAWAQTQQPPAGGPAWGQPQQPPPGAPGWGQPQQPPQGGPAWGQPQQPPPGAPGWGQPQQPPAQYWGQPGGVETGHGTSVLAIIAGIALLLYGLLTMLGGAGLLLVGSFVNDLVNQANADVSLAKAIRDAIAVVAVVILIYGLVEVLAAIGIWAHKGWGRALGIIYGVLGTLVGLAAIGGARSVTTVNGTSTSGGIGVALFILVPYAFVLVAMIIGGGQFRRKRMG
jgi:hypothetical protein